MSSKNINVAIVGVGNCASSFVQGLEYYRDHEGDHIPGLINTDLGGYRIGDIRVVAAFDVNAEKVGRDLSHAIFTAPNNTKKFSDVPLTGVRVHNSKPLDGIGEYIQDVYPLSDAEIPDPVQVLRESGADVLVNYLPVGSQKAVEYWAQVCLDAGVAMVNCMPVFIASDRGWAAKFTAAGVPIVGDDIKSQFGATILHRALIKLMADRGMPVDTTYQLNFGGNTDFQNMLERKRLASKKLSKTRAVTSQADRDQSLLHDDATHIGPSDFVPHLKDNKIAQIHLEGRHFGDVPMSVEIRLSVEDSPNSAGVVVDAVRCAKLALDAHIGGPLLAPSAYYMKSPIRQMEDTAARDGVFAFVHECQSMISSPSLPVMEPMRQRA